MISEAKLDFWINCGYNVLFVGRHGVGKTAIITQAFDRAKLKWRYFSAATMDPWVDFIGVPKEHQNGEGSYLDLVRPKEFQQDTIEALFFDEFNRSHKKIRNAVMELIQFRSINGKKFNNLKLIWAAINPDDEEEYDVEKIDPAQEDRFQIKVDIPYKPHLPYFVSRYGNEIARSAVSWWQELPNDQKKLISPRRLDYALDALNKQGDIRDVLPQSSNVSKLLTTIKVGPIVNVLNDFIKKNQQEEAHTFLTSENNYSAAINYIVGKDKCMEFFLPLLVEEKLSALISTNKSVMKYVLDQAWKSLSWAQNIIVEIIKANVNKNLVKTIMKELSKHPKESAEIYNAIGVGSGIINDSLLGGGLTIHSHFAKNTHHFSDAAKDAQIKNWGVMLSRSINQTAYREKVISLICNEMFETLTTLQAIDLLLLFSKIADRCHRSTVRNWCKKHKWVGMVNHCIDQIYVNEGMSFNDMKKKYHFDSMNIFVKLIDAGLGGTIYVPSATSSSMITPTLKSKTKPTPKAKPKGTYCPKCFNICSNKRKTCAHCGYVY